MRLIVFCVILIFVKVQIVQLNSTTTTTEMSPANVNTSNATTNFVLNDNVLLNEDEYRTYQVFKTFVFPRKYQGNNEWIPSRNITWIHLKDYSIPVSRQLSLARNPNWQSYSQKSIDRADYEVQENEYRQYGNQPVPFNAPASPPAMGHLIDPLFLMATLAFVVFLINSILGLVNRLGSPAPIVRERSLEMPLYEKPTTSDTIHNKLLDELEIVLTHAFDEFDRNFIMK